MSFCLVTMVKTYITQIVFVLLGCLLLNDTYNLKDYLKMSTMPTSMHESLELPPSTESAESGRKILSRRETMHGLR